MQKIGLQQRKTRWTHYQTGYHFVWIPKYRKKVLVGEVQKELKALIKQCADRNGFSILAIEMARQFTQRFYSTRTAQKVSFSQEKMWQGSIMDFCVLRRNSRTSFIRNNYSLYFRMSGQVSALSSQSPKRDGNSRALF